MFKKIMVPVDLAHEDALNKSLKCSADIAGQYGSNVVYVGVTTTTPSAVAHNPNEYAAKLDAFAAKQSAEHKIIASAHSMISHDPTVDMDETLIKASRDIGADLIVMASHLPNALDHLWPSNGGRVAANADCSVFVVRA